MPKYAPLRTGAAQIRYPDVEGSTRFRTIPRFHTPRAITPAGTIFVWKSRLRPVTSARVQKTSRIGRLKI
jgi:hypothetical protein